MLEMLDMGGNSVRASLAAYVGGAGFDLENGGAGGSKVG